MLRPPLKIGSAMFGANDHAAVRAVNGPPSVRLAVPNAAVNVIFGKKRRASRADVRVRGQQRLLGPRQVRTTREQIRRQASRRLVEACRHGLIAAKAEVEAARRGLRCSATTIIRRGSRTLKLYSATIEANYSRRYICSCSAGRRRTKMRADADAHAPSKKTGGYPTWPATMPATGPANPNPMSTKATYAPIAAPLF